MNDEHDDIPIVLFECEECGIDYNPDEEGSDGMCEDCSDSAFENYGADDEWADNDE